jgi:hypothetical protein
MQRYAKQFTVVLWLTTTCMAGALPAQASTDLVGTWSLVASVAEKDGVRREQFGHGANGVLMLDDNGHFMLTIIGPDVPKFASNNRAHASAEESQAVVAGTIAMIGRYAVDEGRSTLTFFVDASTFPNWAGTTQKRVIVATTGDDLEYVTPTASSGGVGRVRWRRLR